MTDQSTVRTKKSRLWLLLVIAAANLIFDQWSKMWARRVLKAMSPSEMTVIPHWWDFRYSENMGSVFGLFRQHSLAPMALTILGILILVLVLAFVVVQFLKEEATLLTTFGYGCVLGGAIGNIIDRLVYGRVTDFIVWYFVTKSPQGATERHEWYTFNVADASLVVGLLLLAPMMIRSAPKPSSKPSAA